MRGAAVHITGIVQGVGFRPWVWKTATTLGLSGTVRNAADGVHIEIHGDIAAFLKLLESEPPPLSRIDTIQVAEIELAPRDGFAILPSRSDGAVVQRISPDISMCKACRQELFDPADRRHRYPFINCVNCGPRFSIIEQLPYDRPQTSMRAFAMCSACGSEYADPADRRYHAQPIACPACGPRMEPENWEAVWQKSMQLGKIVAVKGIGGFHLACDALNPDAVAALRQRKGRESKPFALMTPDLDWVERVCELSPIERRLLSSRERPIVLLKVKQPVETMDCIAPGLNTLGIMLPHSPMHEIMFNLFPHPVVMTSANYTSEPMIHDNARAKEKLDGIADVFLMHDREIVNRCDDSVCTVHGDETSVIRPGRGLAPVSMPIGTDTCILAFGADMKNTFALSHQGQVTLHPYIGDLAHPDSQMILERAVERELNCFRLKPAVVVHDLHPDYFSTGIAAAYAARNNLPLLGVQHHHAHLLGADAGPAIGFAFDGSGYGSDGTVWGGEVLLYDADRFERLLSLRPFQLPGGEAAIKQPARVLGALLHQVDRLEDPALLALLESGINCPVSSSMGRLFDAVACLLGICSTPTYDGEAAMRLEACADDAECGDLEFSIENNQIDWRPMLLDLLEGLAQGVSKERLAARFHNTLAEIVYCCGKKAAEKHGQLPWVFAGGVFQNRLLVKRIKTVVGFEAELIFGRYPNDSGIALGQIMAGAGYGHRD